MEELRTHIRRPAPELEYIGEFAFFRNWKGKLESIDKRRFKWGKGWN